MPKPRLQPRARTSKPVALAAGIAWHEAARLSDELAHCAGRAALSAFALRRPVDAAAALAEVLAATGGKGDGARAAREVLAQL